ncbi:phosphoribosyltransferase family protein [Gryllotalpicola reticulitermitis]|uniref:Phosphoribosyltransferase family protein n=1 Tax=Gryllotalpicola reticulitermitis TaxID=1184153 RepID=A0ABV8QAD8_9MICO
MLFRDRDQAGEQLADLLLNLRTERLLVLGASAGGVLVARHVAERLGAPLGRVRAGGVPEADASITVASRTVLLIDDAIVTGATMAAALTAVAAAGAQRIVVAVPLAPQRIQLGKLAADLYAIARPAPLSNVRRWYTELPEVSEDEVRAALSAQAGQDWTYAGATSL